MAKKTFHTAKHFAKQILKASKKKKKIGKIVSRKVTFERALKQLETKVERKEGDCIDFLRNRVQGLEQELRISEKAGQEATNLNKQRIDELYSELDHLRERKSELIEIKTVRQKRIEEIEKKVRERAVGVDIHKVLEMESQLRLMQERYEQLKKKKKYSPGSLDTVKIAIESLRQKISVKKREAIPAGMKPTPRAIVRHTIKFETPASKKPIPAEEIKPELSPLPPIKEISGKPSLKEGKIPQVPPELMKEPKKTFGQKLRIVLFGKPKPEFKGLK